MLIGSSEKQTGGCLGTKRGGGYGEGFPVGTRKLWDDANLTGVINLYRKLSSCIL